MPSSRSSAASARVRPTTPCLAAQYAASSAVPWRPAIDAMLMMRPARRARIAGRKARVTRNVPLRLASTTSSQCLDGELVEARARDRAGVVDEDVGRAEAALHVRGEARDLVGAPTSHTSTPGAACSAQPATTAPAPESAAATARPMPREAPVTTATLPASERARALGRGHEDGVDAASSRAPPEVRRLEQARLEIGALAHLADERARDDARLRRASRRGCARHMCSASMTQPAPRAPRCATSASAIWCVARSCSVSRFVKQSTSSASRPKPTSLPSGM